MPGVAAALVPGERKHASTSVLPHPPRVHRDVGALHHLPPSVTSRLPLSLGLPPHVHRPRRCPGSHVVKTSRPEPPLSIRLSYSSRCLGEGPPGQCRQPQLPIVVAPRIFC